MNLLISPHNDDSELFMAFTMLREKPLVLVVTDSFVQAQRGDGILAEQRVEETVEATAVLGCPAFFAGIPDTQVDAEGLYALFEGFANFDKVYAPKPYEGGNPHHNLIGEAAGEVFGDRVVFYATYTRDNLYMTGDIEVKPTPEELELKRKALQCYRSQLSLPSTRPHFAAVMGKSEWLYA